MPVNEHLIDIPGRIRSAAIEKHVCGDDQVFDDDWEETQYQINRRLKGLIDGLQEALSSLNGVVNGINETVTNQGQAIANHNQAINNINQSLNNLSQSISNVSGNVSGLSQSLTALANRVTALEGLWKKKTVSGQEYVATDYKVLGAGMYDSTV